jgi:O-methyltransferase involved in polyketide biosynthesis
VKSERDERIAPTAHYTAYVWHRLGLPHAELFVTPTGRCLFWIFRGTLEWAAVASPSIPSMTQYLEMRHRGIEAALDGLEPDRIVEIGAGLSRRGVTWALDRETPYVEVDLPPMIEAKRERLESGGIRVDGSRLRLEPRDILSAPFGDWLCETLTGARRPVVVAEGLLGYFPMDERSRLARTIASALKRAGGGHFVCSLRAKEGGSGVAVMVRTLKAGIRLVTRGRGAREDFADLGAVRRYFDAAGFDGSHTVDVAQVTPHLAHLRSPGNVWVASAPGAVPGAGSGGKRAQDRRLDLLA